MPGVQWHSMEDGLDRVRRKKEDQTRNRPFPVGKSAISGGPVWAQKQVPTPLFQACLNTIAQKALQMCMERKGLMVMCSVDLLRIIESKRYVFVHYSSSKSDHTTLRLFSNLSATSYSSKGQRYLPIAGYIFIFLRKHGA